MITYSTDTLNFTTNENGIAIIEFNGPDAFAGPLVPGRYRLVLVFSASASDESGRRPFDVLVEGVNAHDRADPAMNGPESALRQDSGLRAEADQYC